MPLDARPDVRDWLAQLLRTSNDSAFIFLNPQGTIVAWLGAAERLFGYSADEAIGLHSAVLFTPEDRHLDLHRQEIEAAIAAGRAEDDRWHVRKDGSRFWGSGLLEAIRQPDGSLLALCKIMRDRTDIRTQLDAMQNRLAAREKENARRTNFIVSLGHELRNLLGPMQNATSLIAMSDDPEVRKRSLGILQRQVSGMTNLLDDLSRASEVAVAKFRLAKQPVVVQEALAEAANDLRPAIEQKGQELKSSVPSVSFSVQADPSRLQQMLRNLIGNATKYTPPGGHINLSATVEAEMAVIRVTDDGVGIAPDLLPHIFELFTRDESQSSVPGLGVGLAVVKELATLHGGSVEARSAGPGKGSVFALRLPLANETTNDD